MGTGKSTSPETFLLVETAAGYGLARLREWEGISHDIERVKTALNDGVAFTSCVESRGWLPFTDAEDALENMKAIKEGKSTAGLRAFLLQSLPSKKKKYRLGVCDGDLAKDLATEAEINTFNVSKDAGTFEAYRYCRVHIGRLIKVLDGSETIHRFQLGLGHAFSRCVIQYDPSRQDKHCQQAVGLVEVVDKTLNKLGMRVREWYGWHFPELGPILKANGLDEHATYAKTVLQIKIKDNFDFTNPPSELVDKVFQGRQEICQQLSNAVKSSMGQDICDLDMVNIETSARQVIVISELREHISTYLGTKMRVVAPNIQALLGDILGGKLITQAGSLTHLAKAPASTIQILGAEKALFRALKSKGPTPKYGLLFNSTYIGRATAKNKGRISRYLANKIALASRLDAFSDTNRGDEDTANVSGIYGEHLREQVEERLKLLNTPGMNAKASTNSAVMEQASQIIAQKLKEEKKRIKAAAKLVEEKTTEKISEKKHRKSKDKEVKKESKKKHHKKSHH